MATWRPENSMLTEIGVDMLSRVKSGDGSGITITRIVAGSGRVSESQLYRQTSISGVIKPMTPRSKRVLESGTEISFYITNEDFTESYNLHQIGIFATHPDYVGEKLYFIAQCDSEGYDSIPSFDTTPIKFEYGLFLEHANSGSITITIDPLSSVSREEFDALSDKFDTFKEEVSEGVGSIDSIQKTSTQGLVDTYAIKYTNGSTDTFTVTNGNGIKDIKIEEVLPNG